jgi:hypothetical protein
MIEGCNCDGREVYREAAKSEKETSAGKAENGLIDSSRSSRLHGKFDFSRFRSIGELRLCLTNGKFIA